jgi:hypothetical protein
MLKRGDIVCDFDKEPDPGTNMGKVEDVLPNEIVRVIWNDGTTSERPVARLGKITKGPSHYEMPSATREKMWDNFLQMSDEEIQAEIEELERRLNTH